MSSLDFAKLLESVPDAVLVADMDARIVYANGSVTTLLGWQPSELVGQPLRVIQPERMHAAHDRGFARYVTTGRSTLFGTPIRVPAVRPDGTELDIELNLAAVDDFPGGRYVVGVLRDLSTRVELERQLGVLRHLRAMTAAAARLSTRLDVDHVLSMLTEVLATDFESDCARAWRYDSDAECLVLVSSMGPLADAGLELRRRIHVPSDQTWIGDAMRTRRVVLRTDLAAEHQPSAAWAGEAGLRSVVCLPLISGDTLLGALVHFSRQPIPDEVLETLANLAALAGAALNDARLVEQERAALAETQRARDRFEFLARISATLSASLEPDVTFKRVAEAVVPAFADWCILDQAQGDELVVLARAHRTPGLVERIDELRERYPPSGDPTNPHPIYEVVRQGATIIRHLSNGDLAARARDSRHLELLRTLGIGSHIVAPLVARGRLLGAISLVRGPDRSPFADDDVSTAEDIARRAAVAIDNAQLYGTAREAVTLRDQFLAVASHELRTPLAAVHGHWELLSRAVERSGREQDGGTLQLDRVRVTTSIQRLGTGIAQLRRLTEDLLDVGRMSQNAVQVKREPVELVSVVRQAAEASSAPARVRLSLESEEFHGLWDRARLRQVLDNVIANGLKYTPGGAPIDVSVRTSDHVARVEVVDSGIGIPADQLESIFEAFGRGRNASASHYPGLGLGLAVSREIVEKLGGRMWAESDGEGRGSRFVVELHPAEPGAPGDGDPTP